MEGIKNLIIDFGGVIINLTRNRCVEAFESFGVPDVRDCILNSKDLFMQIEMGTITSAEFRDGIRHLTQQRLTDEQIDAAWIAMLDDIPAYKLDLLMDLRSRYNTMLLSNTNEIHWQWAEKNSFACIDPEETLFLDDAVPNCRTAEALGIRTYTPQPREDWSHLFK